MQIYSETSFAFISKCEKYLKEIIKKETNLELKRNRFVYQQYLYPIKLVVFEGESKLAYFEPATFQIGMNKSLMYTTKESILKDVLRHEFAHFLTFIIYGSTKYPHGDEFKLVCDQNKWSYEVSKASGNLEILNAAIEGDLKAEKVISKIKNLLKLAESDNIHESQAATIKANQLLIKHNLNSIHGADAGDENSFGSTLYVDQLITQKRKSSKLVAILDIMRHFMVTPILNYGKDQVCLEVTGSKMNIELASYVASFLNDELDRLWERNKKENHLKGLQAKNSFFQGTAIGYDAKMRTVLNEYSPADSKALITIQKKLDQGVARIYKRLSHTSNSGSIDPSSFLLGKKAGKNLTINKGLKNQGQKKLLGWLS